MRHCLFLVSCLLSVLFVAEASAQSLAPPEGAESERTIENFKVLRSVVLFDDATVSSRVPDSLQLVALEKDFGDFPAVRKYLDKHPNRADWGVSRLEFIRPETFEVDGRALDVSGQEAVVVWFANLRSSSSTDEGNAPNLLLELWVPDSSYAAYMRKRGYHASYAKARLHQRSDSTWVGSLNGENVRVEGSCLPSSREGEADSGKETLFTVHPPAHSDVDNILKHVVVNPTSYPCPKNQSLILEGNHPLGDAAAFGSWDFVVVPRLEGGSYPQ